MIFPPEKVEMIGRTCLRAVQGGREEEEEDEEDPQTWIINDAMGPINWRPAKICWLFGRRGVLIANN